MEVIALTAMELLQSNPVLSVEPRTVTAQCMTAGPRTTGLGHGATAQPWRLGSSWDLRFQTRPSSGLHLVIARTLSTPRAGEVGVKEEVF